MGLCGSVPTENVPSNPEKEPTQMNHEEAKVKSIDNNPEDLFSDWRELVRTTTCLILIPLYQSLEYEKDSYIEAAKKRNLKNLTDIAVPAHFEKFMNEFLDVPAQPTPQVAADEDPEVRRLIAFYTAAKTAPFREPSATREVLAKKLQDATKQTIKELKATIDFCDASALKINIHFFADLLTVFQGDILSVSELSNNIEEKINTE